VAGIGKVYPKKKEAGQEMKLVKIAMELGIDDEDTIMNSSNSSFDSYKDKIANYLNNKLYMDPEFFGEFGPENIVEIMELD
jgi:hypothetical protein